MLNDISDSINGIHNAVYASIDSIGNITFSIVAECMAIASLAISGNRPSAIGRCLTAVRISNPWRDQSAALCQLCEPLPVLFAICRNPLFIGFKQTASKLPVNGVVAH